MIQKYHIKPNSDFLIVLIGNLFQYQFKENTVSGGYLDTISQQNNLAKVLLALFIPWQHFPSIFINTNITTYKQYCWDLWSKYEHFLPSYIKVLTINVQNLQKNKIDIVLDITIYQTNIKASQSMEIDDLLANLEVEVDSGNLSDNDQIGIFNTLEKSVFFVL